MIEELIMPILNTLMLSGISLSGVGIAYLVMLKWN